MLKKITHMKCEDIFILALFAGINIKNNKILSFPTNIDDLKYKDLFLISFQNREFNNELNVENVIDNLMFDNYAIYLKMKQYINKNDKIIDFEKKLHKKDKEIFYEIIEYIKKFIQLYEKLMFEVKFDYSDTRSIQKQFLIEKMESEIKKENYELCAEIKKIIDLV